jgi:hypothetical protein
VRRVCVCTSLCVLGYDDRCVLLNLNLAGDCISHVMLVGTGTLAQLSQPVFLFVHPAIAGWGALPSPPRPGQPRLAPSPPPRRTRRTLAPRTSHYAHTARGRSAHGPAGRRGARASLSASGRACGLVRLPDGCGRGPACGCAAGTRPRGAGPRGCHPYGFRGVPLSCLETLELFLCDEMRGPWCVDRVDGSAGTSRTVTVTVKNPPKRQPTPNAVGPALGLRQTTGVGLMTSRLSAGPAGLGTVGSVSPLDPSSPRPLALIETLSQNYPAKSTPSLSSAPRLLVRTANPQTLSTIIMLFFIRARAGYRDFEHSQGGDAQLLAHRTQHLLFVE